MPQELLTIEQLAARTQLTVRNIRAHSSRGLLPPPYLKGRTGYYGEEHVARLLLVTGLQQQGFNLAAIERLVAGPVSASPEETVAFYRTALATWLTEPPVVITEAELAAMFDTETDPSRLLRLRRAGVVESLDDGRLRVLNPELLRVGAAVLGLGFDVEALLSILRVLAQHSRAVADVLVATWLETHWEPFLAEGLPPEKLPELRGVIEALQPLAAQAVVAAFQQAMNEAAGKAFERVSSELAGESGSEAS